MVSTWKPRTTAAPPATAADRKPTLSEAGAMRPVLEALAVRVYVLAGSPEERRWSAAIRLATDYGFVSHGGGAGSIIRLTPRGHAWLTGEAG